ncbi:nitrous oxide reductase accessory protein NosL [bacterium]|nr:nitrous oxide reductase accessory protein NosL [bacterium]MBU1991339.1 nitrous oxide reductase accessory protein NosL [bacterium]
MKKLLKNMILASFFIFGTLLMAADSYTMDYDGETTCLVRHFKIAKSSEWVSKIKMTNGKEIFFSSPKSMFEFYHTPGKWFEIGVKKESDIQEILVMDFDTLKPINAKSAFYVYGTNIISPAGDDLVAFDSYKTADAFAKKHHGKRIFGFREVSDALIRLLNGRI